MNIKKNGISIEYVGNGDETLTAYSIDNEGLDKRVVFRIETEDKSIFVNIEVFQSGKREIFSDFILADGQTFNVLKNGIQ